MKNKKIILGVVGLLVAVLLIFPGVMGDQIEKQTKSYFKEIYQATSNQNFEIEFEKGWFTSTATISYELPQNYFQMIALDPESYENFPEKQKIEIQVYHGPIIYSSFGFGLAGYSAEGSFFPVPSEQLKTPYNSIPDYSFHGVMSFVGSVTSVLRIPAFELPFQGPFDLADPGFEQQTSIIKFQEILVESVAKFQDQKLNLKLLPFRFSFSAINAQKQEFKMGFENIQFDGFYLLDVPYPINYDRGTFSVGMISFKMDDKEFLIDSINSADVITRDQATPLLQYNSKFHFGPIGFHEAGDEDRTPQILSTQGSV